MADYAIHDTTLEAIADTIRKKDGTQALIDPADYADRINLMGMLEEKTISGAIASCSDGADEVPLSSWLIDVNPTLTGKSQIVATQAKKNFLPYGSADSGTINQVSFSCDGQGRFTVSGTATGGSATFYNTLINSYTIRDGDYLHLMNSAGVSNVTVGLRDENSEIVAPACNPINRIVNLSSYAGRTIKQVSIYVANGSTYEGTITPMIIHGNTATDFEPYVAPVEKTVNLGQTIYGGQADVVNGTGTETYLKIVLDGTQEIGLANWKPTTGTSAWLYAPSVTPNLLNIYLSAYNLDNIVCDVLPTVPYNTTAQRIDESTTKGISVVGTNNWGLAIRVEDDTLRTKTDINAWLANNPITVIYKVDTPTDFTFTPITPTPETALGVNNFWADTGDSEVVYRSSGTVTPIVPVLTTKSITANGTYNASSDNADGYSSVTVNVPTAPSGMLVMDFTNISSPFTLNGVSYGSTGAVFDNTSDYIDLPFFHAGMEIEIDVASISLGQNENRRFFSSYRNQGFLYRNNNVWSFYNGSWYDTDISDSAYFDNSTVKIVVDSNNYWHIYKDDVLIFEPSGACAISEPAIGSKDGSCINNATITGIRIKEVTS